MRVRKQSSAERIKKKLKKKKEEEERRCRGLGKKKHNMQMR